MIYGLLLALHLMSAAVTGAAVLFACKIVWTEAIEKYRTSAIGALAGFQVAIGIGLGAISGNVSAACYNIAIYLSIVFIVESLLFVQMLRVQARRIAQLVVMSRGV